MAVEYMRPVNIALGLTPEGERPLTLEIRTHDELLEEQFPEMRWIVDGLIPEDGLTLLGGRKKLGKSWLALQIAQGVAQGAPVLGRSTTQGTVVYLALEDGPRRLQARLLKQNTTAGLPITYITRFEPLDALGLDQLEQVIYTIKPLLIIIDTLASAKTGKMDENAAGDMGDLLNRLRMLAQDSHVAILIVAHHGKAHYGDPGDDIRGSSAMGGASDVNMGFYKTENSTVRLLKAEGRDIEDVELRLEFDPVYTWCWQLVGDARQLAKQEADDDVLAAIDTLNEADAGTVARELGKKRQSVIPVLKRLVAMGTLASRNDDSGKRLKIVYSKK